MITVDGRKKDWRPGMSLADALDRALDDKMMVAVRLNGAIIQRKDYASTAVPDGSEILIVEMIAGG